MKEEEAAEDIEEVKAEVEGVAVEGEGEGGGGVWLRPPGCGGRQAMPGASPRPTSAWC